MNIQEQVRLDADVAAELREFLCALSEHGGLSPEDQNTAEFYRQLLNAKS